MEAVRQELGAPGYVVVGNRPSGGSVSIVHGTDCLGQPLSPQSLFVVYCAIKPLLAMVIAALVDDRELSWDDRVDHVLGVGAIGDLTVRSLLCHTSGCTYPDSITAHALDTSRTLDETLRRCRASLQGRAFGRDEVRSRYTESAEWSLLFEVARSLLSDGVDRYAVHRLLEPLGLSRSFILRGRPPLGLHRLNGAPHGDSHLPFLAERLESSAWVQNPGQGGLASLDGLIGLARATMSARSGHGTVLSRQAALALCEPEPKRFDAGLGRAVRHALGWWTHLRLHGFDERIEDTAIGHVGLAGMTAYWVSPDDGMEGGFHLPVRIANRRAVREVRRRVTGHLVDALLSV